MPQPLLREVQAGRKDKSDALVTLAPAPPGSGIKLEMTSSVGSLFGTAIRKTIGEELARLGVADAAIKVEDDGSLDFVLRARIECAVVRARKEG